MTLSFDKKQLVNWQYLTNDYYMNPNRELGKGAFGSVYEGYSFSLNRLIAVKKVEVEINSDREIKILAELSSLIHPNIMGYYGHQINGPFLYIFIEYCPNGTLDDHIKSGLTQIEVLRMFRGLIEGMCYMNAKKKMHRDLKPQNILLGPEMDIKISDFGLAQQTNSIFMTGKQGTPLYAGPEVFLIDNEEEQQAYTNKCDVWSAGMILYEMLTGECLFKGVKNYTDLKKQWLSYERGLKRAVYDKKFHPLWEYFTNWMLIFDHAYRPTFHEVLVNLKRVYQQMQNELLQGIGMQQTSQQIRLEKFIPFQIQKHQTLLDLCQNFTTEDITLCNQFKYMIMFLCILRFNTFTKKFINDLKYKRIDFGQDTTEQIEDQPQTQMLIDKHRFAIEHKYKFYYMQIKKTILPKILKTYMIRESSQKIMKDLKQIVKMVEDLDSGQTVKLEEQEFSESMRTVLSAIRNRHKDVTTFYKKEELEFYYKILIITLLDEKIPVKKFQTFGIVSEVYNKGKNMTKEELIKEIKSIINKNQLL